MVRPGARRPSRSTWLTASRLIRIGCASRTSRSRSETFVPVWLISHGSQPLASAWSTSPGEQASIPTATGLPGAPRPRMTPRIRGSGDALSANRTACRSPARVSAPWSARRFSAGRARSYTNSGVPCSRASASRSAPLTDSRPSTTSSPGLRHHVGAGTPAGDAAVVVTGGRRRRVRPGPGCGRRATA